MARPRWCSASFMGTRRDRRSRDEWKRWVEQWRASELGGRAFAEQHGLGYSSLYRWAHAFEDEVHVGLGFTEVRVREGIKPLEAEGTVPEAGEIEIVTRSGWVVRVSGHVELERLRAVLEMVGSC